VSPGVVMAALRLGVLEARRQPSQFLIVVTAPMFSAMFMSVVLHAGSSIGRVNAVLGPGLIGLWFVALDAAADGIDRERWQGTLESLLAAPAPLTGLVIGRVVAMAIVGLVTLVESWLVAAVGFGVVLRPAHPVLLALSIAVTVFTTVSTATLLAGAFVLTRHAFMLQNSLSYPLYLLGGVLVPVTVLPGWLQPFGRIVFLSWSSDLVRDAFVAGAVAHAALRLAVVVLFGVAALVAARTVVKVVVGNVVRTGSAVRS